MIGSYEDSIQPGQQKWPARISNIRWNPEQHTIIIRDRVVTLTPTEYRLLSPLLPGEPVTYANLARQSYDRSLDIKVRKMMDKHIDRIRGKLQMTGAYIYCVLNYGYILLNEVFPEKEV